MAASSDPDEECFPPTEFFVSSMIFPVLSSPGSAVSPTNPLPPLKLGFNKGHPHQHQNNNSSSKSVPCPVCWRTANKFHCGKCVQLLGQLDEKQKQMNRFREIRRTSAEEIQQFHAMKFAQRDEMELENEKTRLKISSLKLAIALRSEIYRSKTAALKDVSNSIARTRSIVARLQEFLINTRQRAGESKISTNNRRQVLKTARKQLIERRQKIVRDLFRYVFVIETVHQENQLDTSYTGSVSANVSPTPLTQNQLIALSTLNINTTTTPGAGDHSPMSTSSLEMIDALAEASLTTYVNDKWVVMSSGGCGQGVTSVHHGRPRVQYRIAFNCLVDDYSDYETLIACLFRRQTETPMPDSLFNNQQAFGSLSALSYASQAVCVLARLFDLNLPFCLKFAAFYDSKLDEDLFCTLSLKLNACVAFMCFSQGLTREHVCFSRPFWNLFNLVTTKSSVLGVSYAQDRPFRIDSVCNCDFRRALKLLANWREIDQSGKDQEILDEWETVSECLPEWQGSFVSNQQQAPPPAAAAGATLTQLFASATTSVVNLFKNVHS